MLKRFLVAALLLVGLSSPALASNCPAYPYTLTNGSTADANQVMANFNSILNCSNNNLAHNGANSDITSLSGLTTPLSVTQGGSGSATASGARTNFGLGAAAVEALGNNVVDDGSGNLTVAHGVQIFTSGGTFTVPSTATSQTIFEIVALGGGGGGGGVKASTCCGGGGGGSGGIGVGFFSGFSPSQTATVSVGTGGAGGSSSGGNGSAGGTSQVVVNGATIISGAGGAGGDGQGGSSYISGGAVGSVSITPATSGLTLVASTVLGAQAGGYGATLGSGAGGANGFGTGGISKTGSSAVAGADGARGAGGSGGWVVGAGSGQTGGTGGGGLVLIAW